MGTPTCVECARTWGSCEHTKDVERGEVLTLTPAQLHKVQRALRGNAETEEEISVKLLHALEEMSIGVLPRRVCFKATFDGGPGEEPKVTELEPSKLEGVFDAILAKWQEKRRYPTFDRLRAERDRIWSAYASLAELGDWLEKVKSQLAHWHDKNRPKANDEGVIDEKERLRLAKDEGQREMLWRCMSAFQGYKDAAPALLPSQTGMSIGFEIGKVYKHPSGEIMRITGVTKTTLYGECLIGESSHSFDLKPVGLGRDAAEGWREVDKKEWLACFTP